MIAAVAQLHPKPPRACAPTPRPSLREIAARFGTSATGFLRSFRVAIVALSAWLVGSRRGRYVLSAAIVVGCYQGHSAFCEFRLAAERDRLVRKIEDYRTMHGRYPASLDDAGITPDPTLFVYCELCGTHPGSEDAWLELNAAQFLSRRVWEYSFRRRVWNDFVD